MIIKMRISTNEGLKLLVKDFTKDDIKQVESIPSADKAGEYLYIIVSPSNIAMPELYYKMSDDNNTPIGTGISVETASREFK